jgi:hypothetical protein
MDQLSCFTEFAKRFVTAEFQERFLHEVKKRPRSLHRRVCHEMDRIFSSQYKGRPTSIRDGENVFFLSWSSTIKEIPWVEAKIEIAKGGGGHLAIRTDAKAFFAETEAYPALSYGDGG